MDFLSTGLTDGQREESPLFECCSGSCPQKWHQLLNILFPRLRRGIGRFSGLLEGVCYFLVGCKKVLNSGNIGGLFAGGWEGAGLHHLESSLNMRDFVGNVEVVPWWFA